MSRYSSTKTALIPDRVGLLLVNLGTPEQATVPAVRKYLAEFLSDPRVVELPRWLWKPLLTIILAIRAPRSTRLYRNIWTEKGSPLLVTTTSLADSVQQQLGETVRVRVAMRYGSPSVDSGIRGLLEEGVGHAVILPLYPQYSATTTASVFDAVAKSLHGLRVLPAISFVTEYHREDLYIDALAESVRQHWQSAGRAGKLLFSFHGIPRRYTDAGDPYADQCEATASLLAERLGLNPDEWLLVYQSRFGREEWLQPYCDETLQDLPSRGIKHIDICCPGFATDCLETIDEINRENREVFMQAGGESYNYIPCLNDSEGQTRLMAELASRQFQAA